MKYRIITIIFTLTLLYCIPKNGFSFTDELKGIESVIETTVRTKVYWSRKDPECRDGLFGFYDPARDIIIMCQANHRKDYLELLATLKHEGWHAVQHKCNDLRAALSDEQIRPHLKKSDRRVLHQYHPKQHRAEAEARVVEQIPTRNWIRGVKTYCK